MFFNRKKSDPPAEDKPRLSVQTIPADFYAGKNPVVTFKTVSKEVDLTPKVAVMPARHKAAMDKAAAPGRGDALHPVHLLSNRKVLGGIFAAVFILGVGGASLYYWRSLKSAPPPAPVAAIAPEPREEAGPPVAEAPIEPVITPEEAAPAPPAIPKSLGGGDLELPSLFLPDSADSDSDGFTDAEEELFKTDPALIDTDSDKYTDSHEAFNLYNPAGKEPEKIIDSGAVKEFDNTAFDYSVYYPASWILGIVDNTNRDVLFSTITGENIEVRVVDKTPGQSFADWFGEWAPAEQFSDLIPFTSVFKQSGYRRSDYMVYYFDDGARVYVIAYHTTTDQIVNYRTVIKMLARSFRLSGNPTVIPSRPAEEGVDSIQPTAPTPVSPAPVTP
jgi:hypothetical protein